IINKDWSKQNYYLNVNWNTMAAGTIVILYNYAGRPNTGSFFMIEPFVPQWVYLETQTEDASGVSGSFVIGFTDGVAGAQAQPTMQPYQPGTLNQLWTFHADGTIRNASNLSLAITAPDSTDNPVSMTDATGTPAPSQIWAFTDSQNIVNSA